MWKDLANLQMQQLSNHTKSQSDAWMIINFEEEEENESVGAFSTVCSQIVLKCLYLARVGKPDIFVVCEQPCSCGHKMDEIL